MNNLNKTLNEINIRSNSNIENIKKKLNINDELFVHFKDWLSIANTLVWDPKKTVFLRGINNTDCSTRALNNCVNKCGVYKHKKCVKKDTIRIFNKNEILKDRFAGKEYYIKRLTLPKKIIFKIGFIRSIIKEIIKFKESLHSNQPDLTFISHHPELFKKILKENGFRQNINLNKLNFKNIQNLNEILEKYLEEIYRDEYLLENKVKKKYLAEFTLYQLDLLNFFVYKEIGTKNVYLIFSSGEEFNIANLKHTDEFYFMKYYYDYILDYIIKNHEKYEKIILSGHSMGCASAQYLGNQICKNEKLKNTLGYKIWIIGTAPFKTINSEDVKRFNNYYEGKKLIFGLLYKKDDQIYIDEYLNHAENKLSQANILLVEFSGYIPVVETNNDFNLIEIKKVNKIINANQKILDENKLKWTTDIYGLSIHYFAPYLKTLIKLFNFDKK